MEARNLCFGCSPVNPVGLRLAFSQVGDTVVAEFQPGKYHQGYPGIMHGGLVATLLDEAAGQCTRQIGHHARTARLSVRYRHPVSTGDSIKIFGMLTQQRGRFFEARMWLETTDGMILAEGTAQLVETKNGAGNERS